MPHIPAENLMSFLVQALLERADLGAEPTAQDPDRMNTVQALLMVLKEREYQRAKWGGDRHDDKAHNMQSFLDMIQLRLDDAIEGTSGDGSPEVDELVVEIAALAVAALENEERGFGSTLMDYDSWRE